MLASTIQFSNTNPATRYTAAHQPGQTSSGMNPTGPGPETPPNTGVASGPNSVPTHHPPTTPQPPFHAPEGQYLRAEQPPRVTPPVVPHGFLSNHPPHTNGVDRMALPPTPQGWV